MSFNEKVYLRVADQSIELTCSQINALEYDKGQRFFEDQIIEDATLNDLNQKLLAVYQEKMKVTTKTPAEILEARGLIRNGKLTNVAILLFEENPTKFLQSARIRFLRYNGQKAGLGQNITENKKAPKKGLELSITKIFIAACSASGCKKPRPEDPVLVYAVTVCLIN